MARLASALIRGCVRGAASSRAVSTRHLSSPRHRSRRGRPWCAATGNACRRQPRSTSRRTMLPPPTCERAASPASSCSKPRVCVRSTCPSSSLSCVPPPGRVGKAPPAQGSLSRLAGHLASSELLRARRRAVRLWRLGGGRLAARGRGHPHGATHSDESCRQHNQSAEIDLV